MGLDARLNKVMPGLIAHERAVLILRSDREKTREDPAWRRILPEGQRQEFNHYIDLMNGCNTYLPLFITKVKGWAHQMFCACAG